MSFTTSTYFSFLSAWLAEWKMGEIGLPNLTATVLLINDYHVAHVIVTG